MNFVKVGKVVRLQSDMFSGCLTSEGFSDNECVLSLHSTNSEQRSKKNEQAFQILSAAEEIPERLFGGTGIIQAEQQRVDPELQQIASWPRLLARKLERERTIPLKFKSSKKRESLKNVLESLCIEDILKQDERIYGVCIALNPEVFNQEFALFVHRDMNTRNKFKNYMRTEKNYKPIYTKWNWYEIPLKRKIAYWTEPYLVSVGGNIPTISYSVPILSSVGSVDSKLDDEEDVTTRSMGVVCIDIELDSESAKQITDKGVTAEEKHTQSALTIAPRKPVEHMKKVVNEFKKKLEKKASFNENTISEVLCDIIRENNRNVLEAYVGFPPGVWSGVKDHGFCLKITRPPFADDPISEDLCEKLQEAFEDWEAFKHPFHTRRVWELDDEGAAESWYSVPFFVDKKSNTFGVIAIKYSRHLASIRNEIEAGSKIICSSCKIDCQHSYYSNMQSLGRIIICFRCFVDGILPDDANPENFERYNSSEYISWLNKYRSCNPVIYGQKIQFMHVKSGKILGVVLLKNDGGDATQSQLYKLTLEDVEEDDPYFEGTKSTWFTVFPAGLTRSLGEPVHEGEQVRLISARWEWEITFPPPKKIVLEELELKTQKSETLRVRYSDDSLLTGSGTKSRKERAKSVMKSPDPLRKGIGRRRSTFADLQQGALQQRTEVGGSSNTWRFMSYALTDLQVTDSLNKRGFREFIDSKVEELKEAEFSSVVPHNLSSVYFRQGDLIFLTSSNSHKRILISSQLTNPFERGFSVEKYDFGTLKHQIIAASETNVDNDSFATNATKLLEGVWKIEIVADASERKKEYGKLYGRILTWNSVVRLRNTLTDRYLCIGAGKHSENPLDDTKLEEDEKDERGEGSSRLYATSISSTKANNEDVYKKTLFKFFPAKNYNVLLDSEMAIFDSDSFYLVYESDHVHMEQSDEDIFPKKKRIKYFMDLSDRPHFNVFKTDQDSIALKHVEFCEQKGAYFLRSHTRVLDEFSNKLITMYRKYKEENIVDNRIPALKLDEVTQEEGEQPPLFLDTMLMKFNKYIKKVRKTIKELTTFCAKECNNTRVDINGITSNPLHEKGKKTGFCVTWRQEGIMKAFIIERLYLIMKHDFCVELMKIPSEIIKLAAEYDKVGDVNILCEREAKESDISFELKKLKLIKQSLDDVKVHEVSRAQERKKEDLKNIVLKNRKDGLMVFKDCCILNCILVIDNPAVAIYTDKTADSMPFIMDTCGASQRHRLGSQRLLALVYEYGRKALVSLRPRDSEMEKLISLWEGLMQMKREHYNKVNSQKVQKIRGAEKKKFKSVDTEVYRSTHNFLRIWNSLCTCNGVPDVLMQNKILKLLLDAESNLDKSILAEKEEDVDQKDEDTTSELSLTGRSTTNAGEGLSRLVTMVGSLNSQQKKVKNALGFKLKDYSFTTLGFVWNLVRGLSFTKCHNILDLEVQAKVGRMIMMENFDLSLESLLNHLKDSSLDWNTRRRYCDILHELYIRRTYKKDVVDLHPCFENFGLHVEGDEPNTSQQHNRNNSRRLKNSPSDVDKDGLEVKHSSHELGMLRDGEHEVLDYKIMKSIWAFIMKYLTNTSKSPQNVLTFAVLKMTESLMSYDYGDETIESIFSEDLLADLIDLLLSILITNQDRDISRADNDWAQDCAVFEDIQLQATHLLDLIFDYRLNINLNEFLSEVLNSQDVFDLEERIAALSNINLNGDMDNDEDEKYGLNRSNSFSNKRFKRTVSNLSTVSMKEQQKLLKHYQEEKVEMEPLNVKRGKKNNNVNRRKMKRGSIAVPKAEYIVIKYRVKSIVRQIEVFNDVMFGTIMSSSNAILIMNCYALLSRQYNPYKELEDAIRKATVIDKQKQHLKVQVVRMRNLLQDIYHKTEIELMAQGSDSIDEETFLNNLPMIERKVEELASFMMERNPHFNSYDLAFEYVAHQCRVIELENDPKSNFTRSKDILFFQRTLRILRGYQIILDIIRIPVNPDPESQLFEQFIKLLNVCYSLLTLFVDENPTNKDLLVHGDRADNVHLFFSHVQYCPSASRLLASLFENNYELCQSFDSKLLQDFLEILSNEAAYEVDEMYRDSYEHIDLDDDEEEPPRFGVGYNWKKTFVPLLFLQNVVKTRHKYVKRNQTMVVKAICENRNMLGHFSEMDDPQIFEELMEILNFSLPKLGYIKKDDRITLKGKQYYLELLTLLTRCAPAKYVYVNRRAKRESEETAKLCQQTLPLQQVVRVLCSAKDSSVKATVLQFLEHAYGVTAFPVTNKVTLRLLEDFQVSALIACRVAGEIGMLLSQSDYELSIGDNPRSHVRDEVDFLYVTDVMLPFLVSFFHSVFRDKDADKETLNATKTLFQSLHMLAESCLIACREYQAGISHVLCDVMFSMYSKENLSDLYKRAFGIDNILNCLLNMYDPEGFQIQKQDSWGLQLLKVVRQGYEDVHFDEFITQLKTTSSEIQYNDIKVEVLRIATNLPNRQSVSKKGSEDDSSEELDVTKFSDDTSLCRSLLNHIGDLLSSCLRADEETLHEILEKCILKHPSFLSNTMLLLGEFAHSYEIRLNNSSHPVTSWVKKNSMEFCKLFLDVINRMINLNMDNEVVGNGGGGGEKKEAKNVDEDRKEVLVDKGLPDVLITLIGKSTLDIDKAAFELLNTLLDGGYKNAQDRIQIHLQQFGGAEFFLHLRKYLSTKLKIRTKLETAETGLKWIPEKYGSWDLTEHLLRFLQLLCEGHNLRWQRLLNNVGSRKDLSVNIVAEVSDLFAHLVYQYGPLWFVLVYWDRWFDNDVILKVNYVSTQLLDTVIDLLQGPCPENQEILARGRFVESLSALLDGIQMAEVNGFLAGKPENVGEELNYDEGYGQWEKISRTPNNALEMLLSTVKGTVKGFFDIVGQFFYQEPEKKVGRFDQFNELQMKVIEVINAMLEGHVNPEIPSKIMAALNFNDILILMDIALKMTFSAGEPEVKKNFETLCVNYFVMIKNIESNFISSGSSGSFTPSFKELINHKVFQTCERLYGDQIGSVELLRDGKLEVVLFSIDEEVIERSKTPSFREQKKEIIYSVRRDSQHSKLDDFMQYADQLVYELTVKNTYLKSDKLKQVVRYGLNHVDWIWGLTFFMAFVINFIWVFDDEDSFALKTLGLVLFIFSIIRMVLHVFINMPKYIFLYTTALKKWENQVKFKAKAAEEASKGYEKYARTWFVRQRERYFELYEFLKGKIVKPRFAYFLLKFLASASSLYEFLYVIFVGYALFERNGSVYAFLLLDIIKRNSLLRQVSKALGQFSGALFYTLSLWFIFLFLFAALGYQYFQNDFHEEAGGDDRYFCNTKFECMMFVFTRGLRADTGIGDLLSHDTNTTTHEWGGEGEELYPPVKYYTRAIYDLMYFLVVVVIMTAVVSGIIIDAFGASRDKRKDVENDQENNCFVCGLKRSSFDAKLGFDKHCKDEHNMWNYIFFLANLQEKDKTEYNGSESYVDDLKNRRRMDFFPIGRALMLEEISSLEIKEDIEEEKE